MRTPFPISPERVEEHIRSLETVHRSVETLGYSARKRPILGVRIGNGARKVVILGGHHGTEIDSIMVPLYFAEVFPVVFKAHLPAVSFLIVPLVNPDGFGEGIRENARGVDLNRNYGASNFKVLGRNIRTVSGPRAFSEPETAAVRDTLRRVRYSLAVSYHADKHWIATNAYDGSFRTHNSTVGRICAEMRYPFIDVSGTRVSDMEVTGDCITWAGEQLSVPGVTVELPDGHPRRILEEQLLLAQRMVSSLLGETRRMKPGKVTSPSAIFGDYERTYASARRHALALRKLFSVAPVGHVMQGVLDTSPIVLRKLREYRRGDEVVFVSSSFPFVVKGRVRSVSAAGGTKASVSIERPSSNRNTDIIEIPLTSVIGAVAPFAFGRSLWLFGNRMRDVAGRLLK